MVTNINVGLDDDQAERAQAVKAEIGGTWPEAFMEMVELSERLLEAREEDYKPLPVVLEEHLEAATEAGAPEVREPAREPSAGPDSAKRQAQTGSSDAGSAPAHPRDSGGETQAEWVGYQLQKAGVEFPQGRERADCELAVSAAFGYLANAGQATKGQIVLATMPENPLGYDVDGAREKVEAEGERFRGAWWRRVVKPGLEALPGVEKPSGGQPEWRYTGN